jgi:MFS family permease
LGHPAAILPDVRLRHLLITLAAGLALADASVVTLALPDLLVDLHTTVEGVAAVIGVYTIVLALALIPAERLMRRAGAARVGRAGLLLFALASLACAASNSLALLLVARAFQAAGGAAALVSAFAQLASHTNARRLWLAAAVLASAIGPALGGALTQAFDWRAIFLVQAPVAALAAVARTEGTVPPVQIRNQGTVPSVQTNAALPADGHEAIDNLVARGLSPELAADLVDQAVNHLMPFAQSQDVQPVVARALAQRIPVRPVGSGRGHVIGFVGPGGSGKTRCAAQLAAAYARGSSLPVACVALRADDNGAELGRLLAPLGVPMHALEDPAEAAQRVAELRGSTLVVLDTPGVSPRADATVRELAGDLRRLTPDEIHLTLPATYGSHAARELLDGLAPLRPDAIALTHADETGHLGTAIELAIQTATPLSFVSRGAGALRPAAAEELALALAA